MLHNCYELILVFFVLLLSSDICMNNLRQRERERERERDAKRHKDTQGYTQ